MISDYEDTAQGTNPVTAEIIIILKFTVVYTSKFNPGRPCHYLIQGLFSSCVLSEALTHMSNYQNYYIN
jgi:hypothetical protein